MHFRTRALRTLAAVAALATAVPLAVAPPVALAAPKPDVHIPSPVTNVVQGIIPSNVAPIAKVKPGQTILIDTISHGGITEDPVASFGAVGIPSDQVLPEVVEIAKMRKGGSGFRGHILTGPIYVEGAEPGDMLELRILSVEPRVPYGVNNAGNGGVAPGIAQPNQPQVYKFDMKKRTAQAFPGVEVPLDPFMGIMAVAPPGAGAVVPSKAPGVFGGNMDMRQLKAGATVYLPVFHEGALFVTGDSHAAQGDGEVSGNAIEASMAVTVQFYVHKGAGKDMIAPYAEDAENFYAMGMDKDLDIALKKSVEAAAKFMVDHYGLTPNQAYSLCSVAVDFGIGEAVDENLLIYGRIPKKLFAKKTAYWTK